MSFILDALKKSEIERQRQNVPGLMDTRVMPARRRLPVWAIAMGVLLGVNLIVLTVVLTRGSFRAPAPPAAAARLSAAPTARTLHPIDRAPVTESTASASDHFSPLDTVPQYAPEIPVPANKAASGTAPGAGAMHARRPDPPRIDEDAQADNRELLPSIHELSLSGSQALPEMHLDVHVYATRPAERFVYINMHKYREGAVLPEGPTLERIRRDGVVLNHQGLRFILPRQP